VACGGPFRDWLIAERPSFETASAANNVFIMSLLVAGCDQPWPSPENRYFAAKPCNNDILRDVPPVFHGV
jgi:hypothetical protein